MGKRFTGASAHIDSVVVEGGEVRITAVAGATRATTFTDLHRGADVEELVAAETEAAMVLAELVDSSVEKGTAATAALANDDGEEGLREGPVVGGGPCAGFMPRFDAEAFDTSREGLARRIAYAEDVVRKCDAAEAERDLITLPNAEYADLVAAARRDAAFREAFTGVVATDDSEVDLETLNAAFAQIPAGPYDAILHPAGWEVRQLDTDPTNKHHWPVRLCQNIAGRKAGFDGPAANFIAGVLNAWPLIAARLAATEGETASDTSDAVKDDGGPVEPEPDIDALVAAADTQRDTCSLDIRAVRSGEHPHLTVTVTGPGSADLVRQIISDIHLPSLTEPLVIARPVEINVGEFESTKVDPWADLRPAFAEAQLAGGLR